MVEKISIIGSTGSIGVQTLEVAKNLNIKVCGLAAGNNINLLEKQIREFSPFVVSVKDEEYAKELAKRIDDINIDVLWGEEGINTVASLDTIDTVVTSIVGNAGLIPTLKAIRKGKRIALANKETLVSAGCIVMEEARKNNAEIVPVDSEHSAIFQCLKGNNQFVDKIYLTASGGPFRGKKANDLKNVTLDQALNHPNWNMGNKVTIDSATLMNKGLEVIEAKWLFNIEIDKIDVLVHPQSIIHSMVQFIDGSVIAQMGTANMRIPIQYALTYPYRVKNNFPKPDFAQNNSLTFEKPDYSSFPCLKLAFEAIEEGGTMPAVLNASNEVLVASFIKGEIGFMDIPGIIYEVMSGHNIKTNPDINDIIESDEWARKTTTINIKKK